MFHLANQKSSFYSANCERHIITLGLRAFVVNSHYNISKFNLLYQNHCELSHAGL